MGYSLDGNGKQPPKIVVGPGDTEAPPDPTTPPYDGISGGPGTPYYNPNFNNSPVYQARQAAMGSLFPGIGVSRFLNTLGANETDTQDRYGSSPLFSSLMLQGAQPRPEVQVGGSPQVDVSPPPYDPMTDLNDFRRSRKTGGASPYRRQAIQSLFGA